MRVFVSLLLAAALSACVHLPGYPKTWAPRTSLSGHECPEVSGIFNFSGIDGEGRPTTLIYLFPVKPPEGTLAPKHVELQLRAGELQLSYLDSVNVQSWSTTLRQVGECSEGEAVFVGADSGGVNEQGVLGAYHVRIGLSVSADSSLIARMSGSGAAIALLIPVAVVARDWYKFERAVLGEPNTSLERGRDP